MINKYNKTMTLRSKSPESFNKEENEESPKEIDTIPAVEEFFNEHKEKVLDRVNEESQQVEDSEDKRLKRISKIEGISPAVISSLRTEYQIDDRLAENSRKIATLREETRSNISESSGELSKQEQAEAVKESFGEKRAEILNEEMTWTVLSNGANLVPFAGGLKMMTEALAGSEAHKDDKLSGKERIIHGAIGAGSFALDFTGVGEVGKGVVLVGRSAKLLKATGVRLAEKGAQKSAAIFARTSKFLVDNPTLTKQGEKYAEGVIKEKTAELRRYKEGERGEVGEEDNLPLAA